MNPTNEKPVTALARRPDAAVQPFEPRDLNEALQLAQQLAGAGLLPAHLRNRPADLLYILMTGHELGLAPAQAIRSIYCVEGKPSLSAELMVALVMRSGHAEYFVLIESDAVHALYATKRRGYPHETRLAYTIQQAAAARLADRPTWKAYPDAMLRHRCSSALARAVYPDVVLGLLEEDEVIEERERAAAMPQTVAPPPATGAPADKAATRQPRPAKPTAPVIETSAQPSPPPVAEKVAAPPPAAPSPSPTPPAQPPAQPQRDTMPPQGRAIIDELERAGEQTTARPRTEVVPAKTVPVEENPHGMAPAPSFSADSDIGPDTIDILIASALKTPNIDAYETVLQAAKDELTESEVGEFLATTKDHRARLEPGFAAGAEPPTVAAELERRTRAATSLHELDGIAGEIRHANVTDVERKRLREVYREVKATFAKAGA